MDENIRVQLLKYQCVKGCDKFHCNSELCACNPNSVVNKMSILEIYDMISEMKPDEIASKICPNLPAVVTSKRAFFNVSSFSYFVKRLKDNVNFSQLKDYLKSIITIPSSLGYILFNNNPVLTLYNPSITEQEVIPVLEALCNIKDVKDFLISEISKVIPNYETQLDRFSTLRFFILLFYYPFMRQKEYITKLIEPSFRIMCLAEEEFVYIAQTWISKLPQLLKNMRDSCKLCINSYFALGNKVPRGAKTENALKIIHILYNANKLSTSPYPVSFFYNDAISNSIDTYFELDYPKNGCKFSYLDYPFILSLNTKMRFAKHDIQNYNWKNKSDKKYRLRFNVNRSTACEDALNIIIHYMSKPDKFKQKLRVTFSGESAIDLGGPSREFFQMMSEFLFKNDELFMAVNGGLRWFAGDKEDNRYFAAGVIIGLALRNRIVLPIRLPRVVYKLALRPNEQLSIADYAEVFPEEARSLQSIREMESRGEDVSTLCLTFDAPKEGALIEGMEGVDVTSANSEKYIQATIDYYLRKLSFNSLQMFSKGFSASCISSVYMKLDPAELDTTISGEDRYDWQAFKSSTKYKNSNENSRAIRLFWSVFSSFEHRLRQRFLAFVTGSDRSPAEGLGSIKMTIIVHRETNMLPTSHTCFKVLELPDYSTAEMMSSRLMMAITETEGFGFA